MRPQKNLLVFHLESVSWQTVRAFPEAFPNLHAFLGAARSFPAYFSSSTSTQMVLAAFLHGNDFEMDASPGLSAPACNNPSVLRTLEVNGYRTAFLCATVRPDLQMLPLFSQSLPPVWSSNDYARLIGRFESLAMTSPFAVYVWSQVPHVVANMALASHAGHIDDLVAGACAVADGLLGALLEILRRSGREADTTVLVYGDHGDDYYTHGFNHGLLHGGAPHTVLVHAPLAIRDPNLPHGRDTRLASTIDLAPTCLDLLGLEVRLPFIASGKSLLQPDVRRLAFSQNVTASQVGIRPHGPRRHFAANDHSYTLIAGPKGLKFYNFRTDPGNAFNLLHFFDMDKNGRLEFIEPPYGAHRHFDTLRHMWLTGPLQDSFAILRTALTAHVEAKRRYATERSSGSLNLPDPRIFDRINREGWAAFFEAPVWAGPVFGRLQRRRPEVEARRTVGRYVRRLRAAVQGSWNKS